MLPVKQNAFHQTLVGLDLVEVPNATRVDIFSQSAVDAFQSCNWESLGYPLTQIFEPAVLLEIALLEGVSLSSLKSLSHRPTGAIVELYERVRMTDEASVNETLNLAACLATVSRFGLATKVLEGIDGKSMTPRHMFEASWLRFLISNRCDGGLGSTAAFEAMQSAAETGHVSPARLLDACSQAVVWHAKRREIDEAQVRWWLTMGVSLANGERELPAATLSAWYRGVAMVPSASGSASETRRYMELAKDHAVEAADSQGRTGDLNAMKTYFESSIKEHMYVSGDLDEAERAGRDLIALDPAWSISYSELADVLECRGDLAGAAELCENAVAIGPPYVSVHLRRAGMLWGRSGNGERAFECYRELLDFLPLGQRALDDIEAMAAVLSVGQLRELRGRISGCAPQRSAPSFRHDPRKSELPIAAVDATDRQVRWSSEPAISAYRHFEHLPAGSGVVVPVPVSATPVALPGLGVFVATFDGSLRLLDESLTKTYWSLKLGAPVYSTPVVDRDRNRIIVASTEGRVVCLDLKGRSCWTADLDLAVYATPTIDCETDLVVFSCFEGFVIGLSVTSGEERFRVSLPRPWHSARSGAAAHRDPYASPVTTVGGDVIVACAEHLVCLSSDGLERWVRGLSASVRSSPAYEAALDVVAATSVDGKCHMVDAKTGRVRDTLSLGGKVTASGAISGGILAICTQDNDAFGINLADRNLVWERSGAGARDHTSISVLPNGDFVVTNQRGNVVSLGRIDGERRWESSQILGLAGHRGAIDSTPSVGSDGHMYCGSYAGWLYHFIFEVEHIWELA